jgi:hypothetical protein
MSSSIKLVIELVLTAVSAAEHFEEPITLSSRASVRSSGAVGKFSRGVAMAVGALRMIRHANTESSPSLLWLRPPIEQLVGIDEEPPVVSMEMVSSSTTGVASSRTSSPEIIGKVGAAGEVNADTTEAAALLGQLVELVADVGAARQLKLTKEGAAAVEDAECQHTIGRGGPTSGGETRSTRTSRERALPSIYVDKVMSCPALVGCG